MLPSCALQFLPFRYSIAFAALCFFSLFGYLTALSLTSFLSCYFILQERPCRFSCVFDSTVSFLDLVCLYSVLLCTQLLDTYIELLPAIVVLGQCLY